MQPWPLYGHPIERQLFWGRGLLVQGRGLWVNARYAFFATVEQYTAHWNTFHMAVAPTITCLVRGSGAKFPPRPDSLDAFFHHVKEKHEAESDGGQWCHLKNWV